MDDAVEARKLLDKLQSGTLCTISSVNAENKPESALVGYAMTDNLEIVIETLKTTRKYRNITARPHVSIVLYLGDESTLQYEGEARILDDSEVELKNIYFSRNPEGKKWEASGSEVFFLITPKWMRYSNFAKEPREILEFNF
ncbi:MAG TPA: pyridoxamine 5'-phosphate oxidase family protein [Patescibacteria group bacterium]|nr:pyridoxamine 5'-phosphate oxidase family protein [Patescibacteria group bacterium]